jgi:hypothetical protein
MLVIMLVLSKFVFLEDFEYCVVAPYFTVFNTHRISEMYLQLCFRDLFGGGGSVIIQKVLS